MINKYAADLEKKNLNIMLQKAQRYLKLRYALRCSVDSHYSSHCTVFALSNVSDNCFNSLCDHEHSEIYEECYNVFELLYSISKILLSVEDIAKKMSWNTMQILDGIM